ncbi:hypothetical protein Tco_0673968 [Tanacetum coccineum]
MEAQIRALQRDVDLVRTAEAGPQDGPADAGSIVSFVSYLVWHAKYYRCRINGTNCQGVDDALFSSGKKLKAKKNRVKSKCVQEKLTIPRDTRSQSVEGAIKFVLRLCFWASSLTWWNSADGLTVWSLIADTEMPDGETLEKEDNVSLEDLIEVREVFVGGISRQIHGKCERFKRIDSCKDAVDVCNWGVGCDSVGFRRNIGDGGLGLCYDVVSDATGLEGYRDRAFAYAMFMEWSLSEIAFGGTNICGIVLEVLPVLDALGHYETVSEEMDDSLERASTTATSLEAEQDRGGGPRCQETIGHTIAQTRFENVSKTSNDLLLTRGDCKFEKESQEAREEESSKDEGLGEEDASKQGRIADINANKDIYLVNVHTDEDMFGVNDLDDDEVIVDNVDVVKTAKETRSVVEEVTTIIEKAKSVSAAEETVNAAAITVSTTSIIPISAATTTTTTTATITDVEITLTQALAELKSVKPKAVKVVIQEPEQCITTPTPTTIIYVPKPPQDKGKGIMIEEPVGSNKAYKEAEQIRLIRTCLPEYKLKKKKKDLPEKKLNKLKKPT